LISSTPGAVTSASAAVRGMKRATAARSSRIVVAERRSSSGLLCPSTVMGGSTVTVSRTPRGVSAEVAVPSIVGTTGGLTVESARTRRACRDRRARIRGAVGSEWANETTVVAATTSASNATPPERCEESYSPSQVTAKSRL
jgi:hypothetical protein